MQLHWALHGRNGSLGQWGQGRRKEKAMASQNSDHPYQSTWQTKNPNTAWVLALRGTCIWVLNLFGLLRSDAKCHLKMFQIRPSWQGRVQTHLCPGWAGWAQPLQTDLCFEREKKDSGEEQTFQVLSSFQIPCFGSLAIKIPAFTGLHLDFPPQTVFVLQATSLTSIFCSIWLLQWVLWVRQTREIDPHWEANLGSTQTMHLA